MDKSMYKQFLKRHREVNKFVDREAGKLSISEKFKQMVSLMSFAPQIKVGFYKNKHLLTNWSLLKSKI